MKHRFLASILAPFLLFGLLQTVCTFDCPPATKKPENSSMLVGGEHTCANEYGDETCYSCCKKSNTICCDDGSCMDFDVFGRYPDTCCAAPYCDLCTPDYGVPCGEYCAPKGTYQCCNATASKMCSSTDTCCDDDKCCPPSTYCCKDANLCCPQGQHCCNEKCCPVGMDCCEDGSCCPHGEICLGGGECCPRAHLCGSASGCCTNGTVCCGDHCCPKPTGESPCCGDTCCHPGHRCCDGKCCANEIGCDGPNGQCCPDDRLCGNTTCCKSHADCCGGTHCCDVELGESCCGDHCCSSSDFCCKEDNKCYPKGTSGKPLVDCIGFCCPPGQLCVNDPTHGKPFCCENPNGYCGKTGRCCPLGYKCNDDGNCCRDADIFCKGGATEACYAAESTCCYVGTPGTACPKSAPSCVRDQVSGESLCCPLGYGNSVDGYCFPGPPGSCSACDYHGISDHGNQVRGVHCCYSPYSCSIIVVGSWTNYYLSGCFHVHCVQYFGTNGDCAFDWCRRQPGDQEGVNNGIPATRRVSISQKRQFFGIVLSDLKHEHEKKELEQNNDEEGGCQGNLDSCKKETFANQVLSNAAKERNALQLPTFLTLPPAPERKYTPNSYTCYNNTIILPSTPPTCNASWDCMEEIAICGSRGYVDDQKSIYCIAFPQFYDEFTSSGQDFLNCASDCTTDKHKATFTNGFAPCCWSLQNYGVTTQIMKNCFLGCGFCTVYITNRHGFTDLFNVIMPNMTATALYNAACRLG